MGLLVRSALLLPVCDASPDWFHGQMPCTVRATYTDASRAPDTGPVWDVDATYVLACGLRNLRQVYVGGGS